MILNNTHLILAAIVIIAVIALLASKKDKGAEDISLPEAPRRDGIFWCYFGTKGDQVEETLDHVDTLFENQWDGQIGVVKNMRRSGLPTILDVSPQVLSAHAEMPRYILHDAEQNLREFFTGLREEGLLHLVKHLVPVDEPNLPEAGASHLLPRIMAIIKRVASEFPELRGVKYGCIYYSDLPMEHMYLFDWVGTNDYENKSAILGPGGIYEQMEAQLLPNQGLVLVPGATYEQDPEPFIRYAYLNPRVVGCIVFLWRDPHHNPGFTGIHVMPEMVEKYRDAGRRVTGK